MADEDQDFEGGEEEVEPAQGEEIHDAPAGQRKIDSKEAQNRVTGYKASELARQISPHDVRKGDTRMQKT